MTDDSFEDDAIERWMRERPSPGAPAGFTARVMARVGQDRWRVERYWDVGFNVALAGGLVLVAAGILGLVYMSGMIVVGRDALLLFAGAVSAAADQIAPALPTYLLACALTVSALSLWWYVENY